MSSFFPVEAIKAFPAFLGGTYASFVRIYMAFQAGKAVRMAVPVISAGNISMGGTGKTPVSGFLAERLAAMGMRPVILTRGYRSSPIRLPHLVTPGDDPGECGDEPLMLARKLRGKGNVVVDPRRCRSALWALEHLKPDLFILDDGFQHVRVKRDKDLVLLTPHDLEAGWNRVFPWGSWREDEAALKRADIFLINLWGRSMAEIKDLVARRPLLRHCPVLYFDVRIRQLRSLETGGTSMNINNRPYLLATGIANPQKVARSVDYFLGYPPRTHLTFSDHHYFGKKSVRAVADEAKKSGTADIICTSKDAVKLKPIPGLNIWEAIVSVEIMEGMEDFFFKELRRIVPAASSSRQPG